MKQYLLNILALLLILNDNHRAQVVALQDDWYSYVSFKDMYSWSKIYPQLCSRQKFDIYREPRTQSKAEDLRALREAVSPVKIEDDETEKAPEKVTLHVYNNAPVRGGYSLSYGFQRNKECIHGQDSDCIVLPEFGRVRALVLNAERYSNGQNLNYIKDHFQIEDPERFVTILNGGSVYERKFYEAVFLGGLTENGDPRRSSHQINGVSYPMEIYMFFVDETVPSVTLSTVLVVLVEESKRDNPHVKPLVSTVESKLYNQERRFLNEHKYMIRRERLFHNLGKSTQFDIYNYDEFMAQTRLSGNQKLFIQRTIDPSSEHEPLFTGHVEAYEKMESLEATLFFADEDIERVKSIFNEKLVVMKHFFFRKGNDFFPYTPPPVNGQERPHELHIMAVSALMLALQRYSEFTFKDCDEAVEHAMRRNSSNTVAYGYFEIGAGFGITWTESNTVFLPEGDETTHFGRVMDLTKRICEQITRFIEFKKTNENRQYMQQIPYIGRPEDKDAGTTEATGKYDMIKMARSIREDVEKLNQEVYEHLYQNKLDHDPADVDTWGWKDDDQKRNFVSSVFEFFQYFYKFGGYTEVKDEMRAKIEAEVDRLHFPDEKTMREIIEFLKYGDKAHTADYQRDVIHEQFSTNYLPVQQKRRGLVELGNLEMSEEEITEAEFLSPIKVTVNQAFQISWLLPSHGGYYYYEGSTPVPPCFRVQRTIVFKKPIKMSKYQIDFLTRVPTSFNKTRDLVNTKPIIQDTTFISDLSSTFTTGHRYEEVKVVVYNQKRSHLFLGHDGVHKNSLEEFEERSKSSTGLPPKMRGCMVEIGGVVLLTIAIRVAFFGRLF